jgi:O-antigen ligase
MTYLAAGAGAFGAGLLLLSRTRAILLGGFVLLGVAEAALLAGEAAGRTLLALLGSPMVVTAALVALAVVVGLAALLVRHPVAVAPLALVAAPLRPPLAFGGGGFPVALVTSGKLGRLLPLYAVLAAAVLALLSRTLRGEPVRAIPRRLAVPAAAFLALSIVSVLWSRDPVAGTSQLVFFWLPFTALLGTLARIEVGDPRLGRLLGLAVVVPAVIFALVGLGQAAAGTIFFSSPDLAAGNAYGALFRVTSLFDDPSHFGRHLVLAIAVLLVALWLGRAQLWPALAVIALLGAALWFSYSQSSMVSLVAVALAIAFAAGDRRARRLAVAGTVAFALAGAVLLSFQLTGDSERQVTSERSRLVEDSARVYLRHAVLGVGVAGQPLASREESRERGPLRRSASHTTPLTVAAEIGTIGLLAYVALLIGAASVLATAYRRDPPLGLGLAAVLLALFVHSLFYDGFFDNPITWGVLGVAAAVATGAPARAGAANDSAAAASSGARTTS